MSRPGRMLSVLGIAAPIGLLALAWAADRALHHRPGSPSATLPPAPRPAALLEKPQKPQEPPAGIFEEIAASCSGTDGVEMCGPEFATRFAGRLTAPREGLEAHWLAELADGGTWAAYGLGWLGSERALPELRRQLLADRYFYGWETSTPDPPDSVYADVQYPHHQALILAIEKISGRSLRDVVTLSREERARLRRDAAGCDGWRAAIWLLHKLDGAALPGTKRNRAKRIACEGAWLPDDPAHR